MSVCLQFEGKNEECPNHMQLSSCTKHMQSFFLKKNGINCKRTWAHKAHTGGRSDRQTFRRTGGKLHFNAPVIYMSRPLGAGDTGYIARLKYRDLTYDMSPQNRGCAGVLISRLNTCRPLLKELV